MADPNPATVAAMIEARDKSRLPGAITAAIVADRLVTEAVHAAFCWEQGGGHTACDRKAGHLGLHSWEHTDGR